MFEFENTRSDMRNCFNHWEKGKQYIRKIIYINQVHVPTKVTPAIDFTDEPVIQYNVPVVENIFEDDYMLINDKNNKKYI